MQVKINMPDWFAEEVSARGVSVEVYVEELLTQPSFRTSGEGQLQPVGDAIDRLRGLRKGNNLAGLRVKDLIHEGHKY